MASDIVRIQVNKSLVDVLEELRYNVAGGLKQQFGLEEISVPRTLSSQILAAKHQGAKSIQIKIRKTAHNRGILELI